MKRTYFPRSEGDPAPLKWSVKRTVRFEEVDSAGIVWHGRYPSFFEDARVALGDVFGLGYLDLLSHSLVAPVRSFYVDHLLPLTFPDAIEIEALLHWSPAVRLNYEFRVLNSRGQLAASGYSVQLLIDLQGQLQVVYPKWLESIRALWRAGRLKPCLPESDSRPSLPLLLQESGRRSPWGSGGNI